MRKKVMKLSKLTLTLMLLFSSFAFQVSTSGLLKAEMPAYEIYPNPHSITYQEGEYIMPSQVNVVYDDTIDDATKKRLAEIMGMKNKEVTYSTAKVENKTNVFVGTYNSTGNAYLYAKDKYAFDADFFAKNDAHKVISNNNEIVVIGKNSDAAFYGLTSLKHIFNQIDGSTLRNFTIEDYADTPIRGFIEGYYGVPWSNQDRMSLMRLGGEFKMTSYIFAPKDDPYHTSKWRQPYPAAELAAIQEMVQVGIDTKTRFVWTAHPFMGGFNAADADNEIQKLITKFEQLYSVGVRQFGVLGDDVGNLDKEIIIKMMTEISEWGKAKGDVYDTVFCPAGYNHSWQGDYSELSTFDKGFPDDVQIFWTGESVCQPIEQKTLDHFKRYLLPNGSSERRSPLFWLNWPVNDINAARLMMGKGSLLHTDINIEDLAGVVTNPMQEAEASKVAIFAVADYSWNVRGFDVEKSWADSFKYVEPDASEALHTLAKHMSNPQPNGHYLVLAESEELSPLLNQFKNAYNKKESIVELGGKVMHEMDVIVDAADTFMTYTKNEKLKTEMTSYVTSLKALAKANKDFVAAAIAVEKGEKTAAFNAYMDGSASFKTSKEQIRYGINGTKTFVSPGSTHIIPFAQLLEERLSKEVGSVVNEEEEKLVVSASSSFNSFYGGTKIESIVDGDANTYAWHNGYEAAGQYFQVNLSVPTTVYGVSILNGTTGKPDDTFGKAKLLYSTDNGVTFNEVNNQVYGDYASSVKATGLQIENVTNVRYTCVEKGSGNKWPAMREFKVETTASVAPDFSMSVIRTGSEHWGIYSGSDSNLIDQNDSSKVVYRVRNDNSYGADKDSMLVGDYVGLKLSQPIILGKVHIVQAQGGNDYIQNADLEYSMDNVNWTKLNSYTMKRNIDEDFSDKNITAQYIRLRNTKKQNNWLEMNEFRVESKVFFNQSAYTNADALKGIKSLVIDGSATLEPTKAVTLKPNEYIGLKMDRIHVLQSILTTIENDALTLQISNNGYEWKPVDVNAIEGENARYVRYLNLTNDDVTFDIDKLVVNALIVQPKSLASTSGFSIYGDAETAAYVFDKDRTTQTIYEGSQVKGSYVVYDLGQTIDLNSFKAVVRDGENDFTRHGKFSVSLDNKNWTPIMTLGNQDSANPGEAANTDDINYVFPLHEISYNAKYETDLNVKVRYLKFEITRTKEGADKWVRFQEFEINDGAYIPESNDPTIQTTVKESESSLLRYLTDGNLSTAFAPEEKEGSITLQVSEKNTTLNTVKIIQSAQAISNAKVKARVMSTKKGVASSEITLGTLSQTINTFTIPEGNVLLDVSIEWENTNVNLIEFMLTKASVNDVNKEPLFELLDKKEDTSTWTSASKAAYEAALKAGQYVYDSSAIAQTSVDSAIELITIAIQEKAIKGDSAQLTKACSEAVSDARYYTSKTWVAFQRALSEAKAMVDNKDAYSQAQFDAQLEKLTSAQNSLVYNPTSSELAGLFKVEMDAYIATITNPEELYTVNSFKALIDGQATLSTMLETNKVSPIHPTEFDKMVDTIKTARDSLVLVKSLPSLVEEFELANATLYTANSFKVYADAIADAKAKLIQATPAQILEAITQVEAARDALMFRGDATEVNAYIDALRQLDATNYTKVTYQALMDEIDAVLVKLENATDSEIAPCLEQLQSAYAKLINVSALKMKLEQVKLFDAKDYTTSSYVQLKDAIKIAEKHLVDGNKEEISKSINELEYASKKLTICVDQKEAKDYITSLRKVNKTAYTEQSYAKYESAYNTIKALLERLPDVSASEYVKVKVAFEKAVNQLMLVKTPDNPTKPNNPGNGVGPTRPRPTQPNPETTGRVIAGIGEQVQEKVVEKDIPQKETVKKEETKKEKVEKVEKDETPKAQLTDSDNTSLSTPIVIGAVLVAIGGMFLVLKKRKA